MSLKEQYDAINLATIERMVADRREEDVTLDFKCVSSPDFTKRDDRRNLAIAISGFANSGGGIVVWGVDARRDSSGIDRAIGIVPIQQLRLFASRIVDLSAPSASPLVDGVEHKIIERNSDEGFAVTLVPESDKAPHMAKLGEDRYYKRNSSRFYVLEHFDLADMFGRRQRPKLKLQGQLRQRAEDDPKEELHLWMTNDGRAVAKHAGIHCHLPEGAVVVEAVGSLRNISSLNGGRPTISYMNSESVFHPNGIRYSIGHIVIQREQKGQPLELVGKIFCENMNTEPFQGSIEPGSE